MSQGVNITVDIRGSNGLGNPQGFVQNPPYIVQNPQGFVQNPPPYSYIGPQQPQMGYPAPSGSYPHNMHWDQGPPPPHQQQPTSQVIIASPIVVQPTKVEPLGPDPFLTICPNCRHQVTTMVDTETSMVQHLWALGLCIIG